MPPRLLASLAALVLLAAACGARNLLDQPVTVRTHSDGAGGETHPLYLGVPPADAGLPVLLFIEGDGSRCQAFSETLWHRFLLRWTGRWILARPVTRVNRACETPAFVALDLDHRLQELETTVAALRALYPARRIYLLGQSAGAHLAVRYAVAHPEAIAGVANLGGGFDDLGVVLETLGRGAAIAEVDAAPDPAAPYWGRTVLFWRQMIHGGATEAWQSWSGPAFIAHGAQDEDSVPARLVVRRAADLAGRPGWFFRVYDGRGHEVLQPEVMRDLAAWLAASTHP